MSGLPPTLAPWRPLLATLHPAVAEGVGPYLPRLAAAIGPLPAPMLEGQGDPDGVDGLARTGSWDSLLASAWALADEAPDEFLRRAAEGELPFLRQARRRPQGGWRGILWLDVGPEVVGSPRAVVLAATLVLGERIRAAGGVPVLAWRQARGIAVRPLDGVDSLVPWLGERTVRRPTEADRDALLEAVDLDGDLDRLWGLGGPTLARLARGADHHALAVTEALDDDAFDVDVRTTEPVRLRLPTPAPAACVQLLRDPLAPPPAPSVDALADLSLRWSTMGSRLFAVRGASLSWFEAGPLERGDLRWQTETFPAPIVAVGWRRQHPVVLLARGPVLEVRFVGGATGAWRGAPPSLPRPPDLQLDGVTDLWILSDPRDDTTVRGRRGEGSGATTPRAAAVLRDSAGTLWLLDALSGQATPLLRDLSEPAHLFATKLRGTARPRTIFLQRTADGARLVEWIRHRLRSRDPGGEADLHPLIGPTLADGPLRTVRDQAWRDLGPVPADAHRLVPVSLPRRPWHLLAAVGDDAAWLVQGHEQHHHRSAPLRTAREPFAVGLDGTVVGSHPDHGHAYVLDPDGRTIVAASRYTQGQHDRLPVPLLAHAVRPRFGHLAGIDAAGQVVLYDLGRKDLMATADLPERLR